MRRSRLLWGLAAVVLVAAGGFAAAMLVPWSRPCEEERAAARAAWRSYAESESDVRRTAGLRIAEQTQTNLGASLAEADRLGPPASPSVRYREAMERLALAETACR